MKRKAPGLYIYCTKDMLLISPVLIYCTKDMLLISPVLIYCTKDMLLISLVLSKLYIKCLGYSLHVGNLLSLLCLYKTEKRVCTEYCSDI